ncbi:unnamed protein product [Chrysodeixis includens]|uniref:Uncharacterized protein n=1 Tax=Chrysodeixis includens TaxID=689277 RepID=A0A9P0BMS4_CHRIL|nr:unnamed protein product [Chrysodeixis includens]
MHSNMCVKIALCLALIASIDCNVIKQQEVPLQPDGLTVEVVVRNKGDKHVVSTMKIDIDELNKKVVMAMVEEDKKILVSRVAKDVSEMSTEFVPTIGSRHGIRVGTCPLGYTRRGGFCFPNDDY